MTLLPRPKPRLSVVASNLRDAGGRSVALGLLGAFLDRFYEEYAVVLHAPAQESYRHLAPRVELFHEMPSAGPRAELHFMLKYPSLVRELRADASFFLGNTAPPRLHNHRRGVLIHNPWYAYPTGVHWSRLSPGEALTRRVRNAAIHLGALGCHEVAVQTHTMRQRVANRLRKPVNSLWLLPNSITPALPVSLESTLNQRITAKLGKPYALCVSKYYPHKNLEVLTGVADALLAMGMGDRLGIVTTFDSGASAQTLALQAAFSSNGRDRILLNLGTVDPTEVPGLYEKAYCMVLPTLLESFTGTYQDALQHGCHIVTSDRDFARELCPRDSTFVDPLDPSAIAMALVDALGIPKSSGSGINPVRPWSDIALEWERMIRKILER